MSELLVVFERFAWAMRDGQTEDELILRPIVTDVQHAAAGMAVSPSVCAVQHEPVFVSPVGRAAPSARLEIDVRVATFWSPVRVTTLVRSSEQA